MVLFLSLAAQGSRVPHLDSGGGGVDLRCESLPIVIGFQLQLKTEYRCKDFFVGLEAMMG
jgi:hypothetical protein